MATFSFAKLTTRFEHFKSSITKTSNKTSENAKEDGFVSEWTIVGKTCLVTGANCGIGKFTVLELARRGAKRIILACRNVDRGEEAVRDILKQIGEETKKNCELVVKHVDLSSIASVRKFAADILANEPQLDVLINNAGVLQGDNQWQLTEDGFEVTFETNFLGPFLLTNLLLDLMKTSKAARIVMVTSQAYQAAWPKGYDVEDVNQTVHMRKSGGNFSYWRAYSQSKLAIVLYARYLHKQLNSGVERSGISVFCLHPGEIRTNITRQHTINFIKLWLKFLGKDADKGGSAVPVYCACQPGIEKYSGKYFQERCKVQPVFAIGKDEAKAEQLVQRCQEWTGLTSQ